MESDFYVYLPSTATNIWTSNTNNNFNVELPQCIELDTCWKVGLKQLIFPRARAGRSHMFIHSSIVKASAVGKQQRTLLDMTSYASDGYYDPKNITYHSLSSFNFHTIDIQITDQKFEPFQFAEGDCIVVLHFKYFH